MRFKFLALLTFLFAFTACGDQTNEVNRRTNPRGETDTEKLRKTILALQGLQTQIDTLVLSDYASCNATPVDGGSTNDALVRKICQISQAAGAEAKVEMKGQLASYSRVLKSEVSAIGDRLDVVEATITNVTAIQDAVFGPGQTSCPGIAPGLCFRTTALETSVADLEDRMDDAESAIDALELETADLQDQIDDINAILNSVIAGAVLEVTIGNENLSAGPLYETVLRKQDRSRINAYIEDLGAKQSLGNNPFSTSNGSPTVTVTLTAHGLAIGNVVKFNGLAGGRGFSSGQVNDQYSVVSVTTNTFTITMSSNASSGGTLGGSAGYLQKINGRGLGQAWATANGEVTSVSTFSAYPYTFLITGVSTTFTVAPTGAPAPVGFVGLTPGSGWICYSKTNRSASSATIKAGGVNIVCK